MRIVWTEPALRDLTAARTYIALDNPAAAEGQFALVISAVSNLARFPESARPGRWAGTRELVVHKTPFLVPYRIRDNAIEVLRVLHSRQRWPEHP
jgi:toxin ParE1/3/4